MLQHVSANVCQSSGSQTSRNRTFALLTIFSCLDTREKSVVRVANIVFIWFYSTKCCVIRILYLIIGSIEGVLLHTEV